MDMKYKNILVVYKESAYRIYFEKKESSFQDIKARSIVRNELKRFKKAHDEHYQTLDFIKNILSQYKLDFTKMYRGKKVDYHEYDLIITVGGDGTFLDVARKTKQQVILGVNSALEFSVGCYCLANKNNFETILNKIISGKHKIKELRRLKVSVNGETFLILNDVLVCHENPAALYRYMIKIKGHLEEQRSSGVWISTASGSSGAIMSSGGKKISNPYLFQYNPRELQQGILPRYKLKGGILREYESIKIITLARQSRAYFDGAHCKTNLQYGDVVIVQPSTQSVKIIDI